MSCKQAISWSTIVGLCVTLCVTGTGCMEHQTQLVMPPMPPPNIPSELTKQTLPTYRIEPPDILLLQVMLPPKDILDNPVNLWPQPIGGNHLVRIDGTISLGSWGSVQVAGMTLDEAAEAIRHHVYQRIVQNAAIRQGLEDAAHEKAKEPKEGKEMGRRPVIGIVDNPNKLLVAVDVFSYNSKTYYVITDGAGYGEQIYSFPVTGNDTVLQALSNINGIPTVASKRSTGLLVAHPCPICSKFSRSIMSA